MQSDRDLPRVVKFKDCSNTQFQTRTHHSHHTLRPLCSDHQTHSLLHMYLPTTHHQRGPSHTHTHTQCRSAPDGAALWCHCCCAASPSSAAFCCGYVPATSCHESWESTSLRTTWATSATGTRTCVFFGGEANRHTTTQTSKCARRGKHKHGNVSIYWI